MAGDYSHLQLDDHFQLWEFRCKGTTCACGGAFRADETLVRLIEAIRYQIGEPIRIDSGFRCRDHNTAVNGFPTSYHMWGMAADITCQRMRLYPLEVMADEIGRMLPDFVGPKNGNVIYYPGRGYIHVDIGPTNWETIVRASGATKSEPA